MRITLRYIIPAMLCAASMTACHNHGSHEGHHHDSMLQLTAYSDGYEVFAEASPLAAGSESHILAHFTKLSSFKPLENGTVTATLIAGGDSVSQTCDSPLRPGIYKFHLTPTAAGEAKIVFDITAPDGHESVTAGGLTVYDDSHLAAHEAEEAEVHSSNGAVFTKEMGWKTDFKTEPVTRKPMGEIIHTMGRVEPSQGDARTIVAKSAGLITFADGTITDGAAVRAGQALFRIDGSATADNNLRVSYLQAKNDCDKAKADYDRTLALAEDRLVTNSELLAAKNAYANAKAVYDNLRAGFADGAYTVTSPITGHITRLMADNGQYAEAGQPLAVVAQNRDLLIRADVQPSHAAALPRIDGAVIRRPNSAETIAIEGAPVSCGRAASADNPLIPVVFSIAEADGLVPGTFVEMYISAGSDTPVLAIPSTALIEEMGNYFVYVQLTPELFEKREVSTGRTDGRNTEILSGIAEGERVVTRGATLVKLANASGALDAHSGHVH